jgi:hypothetical protein
MYESKANAEQKTRDAKGSPFLDVLMNILGALPATARPSTEMIVRARHIIIT